MSIGNTISEGNKGINFPWQLKMLLGQQCACDQLTAIAGNTDQVEYLLTAILTSLQASTDYEAKFVLETCPGPPVTTRILLEVRIWDQDSQQWVGDPTYYLPGDATPTTIGVGCTIEYTDPSGVLALILGAIQAGNLILTDIETNTGDTVTELQSLLALYTAGQSACASSLSVTLCTEQGTSLSNIETNTTGLATEVTLLSVDSNVAQLVTNTTSANRTPNLIRPSGIFGNTPVGTYSVSFASVGTANATVGGMILKPGETVNFDGGAMNNTVGVIAYDTTLAGAELIITYLI